MNEIRGLDLIEYLQNKVPWASDDFFFYCACGEIERRIGFSALFRSKEQKNRLAPRVPAKENLEKNWLQRGGGKG